MFIDDKEKMKDFFELSKKEFLNSYSYLTEEEYFQTVKELWNSLEDVPVVHSCLDTDWYVFNKGYYIYDIWSWFEDHCNVSVAIDLMELSEGTF